jgi:hypothetical protein
VRPEAALAEQRRQVGAEGRRPPGDRAAEEKRRQLEAEENRRLADREAEEKRRQLDREADEKRRQIEAEEKRRQLDREAEEKRRQLDREAEERRRKEAELQAEMRRRAAAEAEEARRREEAAARRKAELEERRQSLLLYNNYINTLQKAVRELESNNGARAESTRAACPAELRGWEWEHLRLRCSPPESATLPISGWVRSLAFSPDGRQLAVAQSTTVRLWEFRGGKEPVDLVHK